MLESSYQQKLIKRLRYIFGGCVVIKNDPTYIQGLPDLLILYGNKWAMLEVKADGQAEHQPNQDYYVERLNAMSFAAFIFPQNETYILNRLSDFFMEGIRNDI